MKRLTSIDFVRGFVMMIMALDHVRDMIHVNSIDQSPTNLATTTPILFFTRWITYLCAPIFVFLAGSSAYMSFVKNNNFIKSRNFLFKRGLYLILLELTVVNFLLFFDVGFHSFLFEVIAAIGFGFIVLGLMLKLPPKTIGIIGLVIIFCHNLFPLLPGAPTGMFKTIFRPLFNPSAYPILSNRVFVMGYPPIPWLGIMLAGFAAGKLFTLEAARRTKLFWQIGAAALLLFLVIRFINIYGDSLKWSVQDTAVFSFLSFMNVTKYPPSLVFCLVTLGIMFVILAIADQKKGWFINIATVYGRVPLFYFLAHFLLVHIILLIVLKLQGLHWAQLEFATGTFGRPKGLTTGLSLGAVYLIWIAVVASLYLPCKWFGEYKATQPQWWLKYL